MLETYRVQIRYPLYGGDDQTATNTLYFRGNDPLTAEGTDISEILDRVQAYINAVRGQMPSTVFGASMTPVIVIYRMSDVPPRLPIFEGTDGSYTPSATQAYPSDIAICLSFRADYTSGTPRARKRGRIFIGPVIANAGTTVANQGVRITAAAITAVLAGATALATQVGSPLWWVQWSETDGTWNLITEAWVDNQFDTRRSRDRSTVTRTAQPITQ